MMNLIVRFDLQPIQQVYVSLHIDARPVELDPADDLCPAALGALPLLHPLCPSDILEFFLLCARCREESNF